MFVNNVNPETGNPVCMCGKDCEPNGDNDIVNGSKGLVILHRVCVDQHNTLVQMGAR